MRPQILFPYFADVTSLKGVGQAAKEHLTKLLRYKPVIERESNKLRSPVVRDILFHVPTGSTDRRHMVNLSQAQEGQLITVKVRVMKHVVPPRLKGGRRLPYRVEVSDDTGDLQLVYFNARSDYLQKLLPEGQECIISGRVERYDGGLQMPHPDIVAKLSEKEKVLKLEPNYPLTLGFTRKQLAKIITTSLEKLTPLPEWIEAQFFKQKQWATWHTSIAALHAPNEQIDIEPESIYRQRLAYDELLAHQLALGLVRERAKKQAGIIVSSQSTLREKLQDALPFKLTQGQHEVLKEIDADMSSGDRMLRLLQGDVGSGKTLVALMTMLPLIEQGYQAALMVPTDILGRQHLESIRDMVEPLGLNVAMLTGRLGAKERTQTLEALKSGDINIVIGTHALFQDSVEFHKLGIAVIDEQHRFGVNQRLALSEKGHHPHILLMTATPIPRSLSMTAYGDMDCSLLTEKPAGRQPIETRAVPLNRMDEVVEGLKRAISSGAKVYWICPLVEESEEEGAMQLTSVTDRYKLFQGVFGERVAIAHGQMPADEREAFMKGFAGDDYDILVATTVVEVGVNVPDATIMVIEHAERFGLSQLHQLRGRVGRGDKPSSCILLYHANIGETSKRRLQVIRESNDGFYIAEEDLVLRGAGDALGTRQSGFPDYVFADPISNRELLLAARDDAKMILHADPMLKTERGEALRVLLYLYEYDACLRYLDAG